MAAINLAAKLLHHGLLAVADAQNRHAQGRKPQGRAGRSLARHAIWAARQDHSLWREFGQKGVGDLLIGVNFTIDVQLAQAARNKLRHLAAEVDDKEAFVRLYIHERVLDAGQGRCARVAMSLLRREAAVNFARRGTVIVVCNPKQLILGEVAYV